MKAAVQSQPDVDPITFEVIRHRLRAIIGEQAARVSTVSGSAHVTEMSDYNVGLYLADGSVACMGRTILFHAASMAAMVRHVIADCAANPGIGPGDMFAVNNPWKGAVHGPDLAILAPVFSPEGQLLFWSGAMMHMADIGGMRAGSMGLDAAETFQEGLLLPPVRLIEGGVIRQDLWQLITSHSRVPGAMALDLKGLIAANNSAVHGLLELARKYSSEQLTTVMRVIIDSAEERLRERIRELPEMTVQAVGYLERDRATGAIAQVAVSLVKEDDHLTFDFTGSSAQMANATNCTEAGLQAGVYGALLPILAHDIPWNAGLFRPVRIDCPEGLICNARRPAAVSGNIGGATWEVESAAITALSKLIACSPAHRAEAQASSGGRPASPVLHGRNQFGERFIGRTFESLGSGAGAYSDHDGVSAFGNHSIERVLISNMESIEQDMPILYLWRGLIPDSGGPGQRRGGLSIGCAYTAHGGSPLIGNLGHAWDVPSAAGMAGGYMGASNRATLISQPDLPSRFGQGTVPAWADLPGPRRSGDGLPPVIQLAEGDVLVFLPFAAAGWGDPLDRDVADLQRDLDDGVVSVRMGQDAYGAVLAADGTVAPAATGQRRARLRERRKAWPRDRQLEQTPAAGPLTTIGWLSDQLVTVTDAAGRGWTACACGCVLALAKASWREFVPWSAEPPDRLGLTSVPMHSSMELRRYCCPSCGRLHACDVRPKGSPHLHDLHAGDLRPGS